MTEAKVNETGVEALDMIYGGLVPGLAALYGPGAISTRMGFWIAKQLSRSVEWQSNVAIAASDWTPNELADELLGYPNVRRTALDFGGFQALAQAVATVGEGGLLVLDSTSALEAKAGVIRKTPARYAELEAIRSLAVESNVMVLACGRWDVSRKRLLGTTLWEELARNLYVLRPRESYFGRYQIEAVTATNRSQAASSPVTLWLDDSTIAPMPDDPSPPAEIRICWGA
ncbi:hypothetical protein ACPXCG_03430 [Gordonia sp. DT218]|uniref:hypothetical protein n=1 Tax=Gordonia sp. DT218 TaxID=3416659 RepID=UPI003CEAE6A1